MKRPVALFATASMLFAGCSMESSADAIKARAGVQPTPVERLESTIQRDIIPQLGSAGLMMVLNTKDKATNSLDLIVTHDTFCASTFNFTKEEPSLVSVRLTLFGNFVDLIDVRQLNGPAMFDGTIGHGDNIVTTPVEYTPGNPSSTSRALDYMQYSNDQACNILSEPPLAPSK